MRANCGYRPRKEQALAILAPVPAVLSNTDDLVHQRVITAPGVIVEPACWTAACAGKLRVRASKEQALAILAPVPAVLAQSGNLVRQSEITAVGVIVEPACWTSACAGELGTRPRKEQTLAILAPVPAVLHA